jgi:hypothetical protein
MPLRRSRRKSALRTSRHVRPSSSFSEKVEQLKENIAALDISLASEQVQRIEEAAPFDPGFPNRMVVGVSFLLLYTACL